MLFTIVLKLLSPWHPINYNFHSASICLLEIKKSVNYSKALRESQFPNYIDLKKAIKDIFYQMGESLSYHHSDNVD